MTKPTCDYCHGPFEPKTKNQRFCHDKCRNAWHKENRLPGKVTGIRALKRGGWSVTVHYPDRPAITMGSPVRLETLG